MVLKARWTGQTEFLVLTHDKVYTVLGVEKGWYRLVDDSGEDYLYPSEQFEIVEGELSMTIQELKTHLTSLTSHVTFEYNGYFCGIDPLSRNEFNMWYGKQDATVQSVKEVLDSLFFDGKALKDIWDEVTDLDY